ncbi:MAG: winged helix-turn-helix transcriptional regulator [bacterium]|nr:winged helix-turn-helix transcriptional regulator [bacterium]
MMEKISVVLPVITDQYHVTNDESKIISALENGEQLSSNEIAKVTGYTKSKTLRLIERLKEKDYIKVIGNGRGTKYSL